MWSVPHLVLLFELVCAAASLRLRKKTQRERLHLHSASVAKRIDALLYLAGLSLISLWSNAEFVTASKRILSAGAYRWIFFMFM